MNAWMMKVERRGDGRTLSLWACEVMGWVVIMEWTGVDW
jgi:hypothetical protein